jgi:hypothetical protein
VLGPFHIHIDRISVKFIPLGSPVLIPVLAKKMFASKLSIAISSRGRKIWIVGKKLQLWGRRKAFVEDGMEGGAGLGYFQQLQTLAVRSFFQFPGSWLIMGKTKMNQTPVSLNMGMLIVAGRSRLGAVSKQRLGRSEVMGKQGMMSLVVLLFICGVGGCHEPKMGVVEKNQIERTQQQQRVSL